MWRLDIKKKTSNKFKILSSSAQSIGTFINLIKYYVFSLETVRQIHFSLEMRPLQRNARSHKSRD